jgi:hypothetical protein
MKIKAPACSETTESSPQISHVSSWFYFNLILYEIITGDGIAQWLDSGLKDLGFVVRFRTGEKDLALLQCAQTDLGAIKPPIQ